MTTVFVGVVAATAAGAQFAVGQDAPVAFNVRPDLIRGVYERAIKVGRR